MSNKPPISWRSALSGLHADRATKPLSLRWSVEPTTDCLSRHVGRDAKGEWVGLVYAQQGRLFALVHPADPARQPVILPGSYDLNAGALRTAKVAIEAFVAEEASRADAALVAQAHTRGATVADTLYGERVA